MATPLLFAGCSTNAKVGSDPVTVTMEVINKTDQDFTVNCSWCVDKKNQTHTVKAGATYVVQSNTHEASGTVFTVILPFDIARV